MEFVKYQHVEKLGNSGVRGILDGTVFIFPKIDGTNASVWMEDGNLQAGSRNRLLELGKKDNAGFFGWVSENETLKKFFVNHPGKRLYGEWLVPHSLKTYREEAWRDFYVFDVMDEEGNYIPYNEYKILLEEYGINYIPCLGSGTNISDEQLCRYLEKNNYLIEDGNGVGEGIVIKNYSFVNRYGRIVWAKLVTSEFKERHSKEMGHDNISPTTPIEEKITNKFCTMALIEKEYNKILLDNDGWDGKCIPRLLHTVYHSIIQDDIWNILKEYKNPVIDFRILSRCITEKIKKEKLELF